MGYVSASHLRRDYNACNENLTWYIIKRTDFNGGISIKPYTKFELFYVANMDPFWASKFNIEGTIQEVNEKLTNDYKKHTDNHKIYAFDCMLTLEKDDAISKILSSMGTYKDCKNPLDVYNIAKEELANVNLFQYSLISETPWHFKLDEYNNFILSEEFIRIRDANK